MITCGVVLGFYFARWTAAWGLSAKRETSSQMIRRFHCGGKLQALPGPPHHHKRNDQRPRWRGKLTNALRAIGTFFLAFLVGWAAFLGGITYFTGAPSYLVLVALALALIGITAWQAWRQYHWHNYVDRVWPESSRLNRRAPEVMEHHAPEQSSERNQG